MMDDIASLREQLNAPYPREEIDLFALLRVLADAERYRMLRDEGYLDRFAGDLHPCDEGRLIEFIERRVDEFSELRALRAVVAG